MDDTKLLEEMRKRLKLCVDEDTDNRAKMLDDLKFCTLDQWDANIRAQRENDPNGARPCLTIDKINQYIVQVVNDMRQNRPGIKVRPVDDGSDPETAKVYQGIVRHIEDRSAATIAYEAAGESQVKMGLGYFRVITDYVDGSFDQEILVKRIPDTFSVYLGPHIMPDGSDAEYGFVTERVQKEDFKLLYPNASADAAAFEDVGGDWGDADSVFVTEYFYTEKEQAKLLFLADGSTVYADKYDGVEENIVKFRNELKKTVKWVKATGIEILERKDWAGKYIPIIEVVGRESFVEGKRILWGLVRPAKDNLRMYNYWASAITEKIGLSPKTPFIGAKGQFDGLEDKWRSANRENRAYLEYNPIDVNGNAIPRPERVQPSPIEVAMVHTMGMIENDVRASLGMYKAAVGDSGSQQSGKALLALQRESDTGTSHFSDNLAYSIQHCGRIIVDLIPKIYDTRRIVRILGEDGEVQSAVIDPTQKTAVRGINIDGKIQKIYNPGVGEYDVTVTIGPSYNTKRMEAAQVFSELARGSAEPASAAVLRYLTVKNSDFTSSDEALKMLKSLLPQQALQAVESPDGQAIPPQAMQKIQQMQEHIRLAEEEMQRLAQENQQLKVDQQTEMAKVSLSAQESKAKLETKRQEVAAEMMLKKEVQEAEMMMEREKALAGIALEREKIAMQMQLEREKAEADIMLESAKIAQSADADIDKAIQQITGMVAKHKEEVEPETAQAPAFDATVQAIIESLNRKKTINLIKQDGMTVGATVE